MFTLQLLCVLFAVLKFSYAEAPMPLRAKYNTYPIPKSVATAWQWNVYLGKKIMNGEYFGHFFFFLQKLSPFSRFVSGFCRIFGSTGNLGIKIGKLEENYLLYRKRYY